MRRLALLLVAVSLPGCFLVFDEHGKGGDDDCLLPPATDQPLPGRAAPPPQRNPQTLACETLGGGTCDPNCGPCPALPELAPLPSWGFCFSACESLDEAACEADSACRVIKDAECAISGTCLSDFVICVATDQFQDPAVNCTQTTDAESCSRNPACTAYHVITSCTLDTNECTGEFAFCGPEGRGAGRCFDAVACDRTPPACPVGTTPGVANGCFTDACIPDRLCEPQPGA